MIGNRAFRPNLDRRGRQIRGAMSAVSAIGGALLLKAHPFLGVVLFASAAFLLFEALRGWCALRACGVRTKF